MPTFQDDYTACSRTRAMLRLFHTDLDPDDVSRRLGIAPTSSFRRGDPRGKGSSDPRRLSGGWLRGTETSESKDVQRHIVSLLDLLEPVASEYEALRESQASMRTSFATGK